MPLAEQKVLDLSPELLIDADHKALHPTSSLFFAFDKKWNAMPPSESNDVLIRLGTEDRLPEDHARGL